MSVKRKKVLGTDYYLLRYVIWYIYIINIDFYFVSETSVLTRSLFFTV